MNSINGSKARADALPFELKFEPTFERKVQRRIRLAWLALLISGVVLLWWSEFSRWGLAVEFWVSRQFYQAGVGFPLRDSAQFDFWWHIFPKRMMFLLPLWALLQIIYGFVLRHQNRLAGIRRDEWLRWCAIFFHRFAHAGSAQCFKKMDESGVSVEFERFWRYLAVCAFARSAPVGGTHSGVLAGRPCGGWFVHVGGELRGRLAACIVA